MATHRVEPERATLHGSFDRDLAPILTVEPGDTVLLRTLDSSWSRVGRSDFGLDLPEYERDPIRDGGHALCGPIAVRGAEAGDVLEVQIDAVQPGDWGWTRGGPGHGAGDGLGLTAEVQVRWRLDAERGMATDADGLGITLPIRPFMGVMGNAPAAAGPHSTTPPRRVGGNLDCRELAAGSTLWLPVDVEGALFSVGDGHATQGDGEVSGVAIECPMERVALTFQLRKQSPLALPEAQSPAGWLTFGFGETLDAAARAALSGMLDHLEHTLGVERSVAMALASCVVHLRITQVVNETVGVHAVLPPDALQLARPPTS